MKYYIYISETKVNMLYDQIGLDVPKAEKDWGILREYLTQWFSDSDLMNLCFDLGVDYENLKGTSKGDKAREMIIYLRHRNRINELIKRCRELRPGVEWPIDYRAAQIDPTASLYSKLNTLVGYLDKHNEIGSLDSPKAYFKGELVVRWGEFSDTGLVYFTGMANETLLALGGSLKHVIGNKPIEGLHSRGSETAGIQRSIIEELELKPLIDTLNQQDLRDKDELSDADSERMIWAIENACGRIAGSKDRLEFVARRLRQWEESQIPEWLGAVQDGRDLIFYSRVVLGTPIYVAYVD